MTSKSLLVLSRCLLSGLRNGKKVPLLRRSVRDSTGKVFTSPTHASQFNQMSSWNRRLGRSFGMKETFEFKVLRRAAAAALPGKSS